MIFDVIKNRTCCFLSLVVETEHGQDLSVPETKCQGVSSLPPPMSKLESEFMHEVDN